MMMSKQMQPWWIDTDPGVDDAWAILMLANAPAIQIVGLSVVGGNVGLPYTLRNACRLVDLIGRDLPVYAGAQSPLIGGLPDAGFVHGSDGFGEADLPAPQTQARALAAALALIEAAHAHPGQLNVLALGPLTNLALACMLDPGLPQRCRRFVVMGGAVGAHGNTRVPAAEFNLAFDPEAAAMVFARWPGIQLIDWELTLQAAPTADDVHDWLAGDSQVARWLHSITRSTAKFVQDHGHTHWAWADPLAALVALQPDAVTLWTHAPIEIALASGPTRGQTVVDWHGLGGFAGPPVAIARGVDREQFHRAMRAVL
jgi:purine nucleosidase